MNILKHLFGSKPEPVVILDEDEPYPAEYNPYLDPYLDRLLSDDEDDTANFYIEMEELDCE